MISVKVEGIGNIVQDFKGYEKQAARALKDGILATAYGIHLDAIRRLSGQEGSRKHWITGRLATSLNVMAKEGVHIKGRISGGAYTYTAPDEP
jgi:hypothetical protein